MEPRHFDRESDGSEVASVVRRSYHSTAKQCLSLGYSPAQYSGVHYGATATQAVQPSISYTNKKKNDTRDNCQRI